MAKNNRSLSLRRKEEELADMEQKTQQIREWIEGLLKEKLPKQPFREVLLDGVVLCKLANAIKRDCIKRYHKKPRMLMMKMENIAFFLTAAKSRFNIPQAVIFAPTDIHDDSYPTSMRKVINVLLLMQQEMGGGPSAAEAAKELEEAELKRQKEMDELEQIDIAAGVLAHPTPKPQPKPLPVVEDPQPPSEDQQLSDDEGEKEKKEAPAAEPEPEPEPQPPPKAATKTDVKKPAPPPEPEPHVPEPEPEPEPAPAPKAAPAKVAETSVKTAPAPTAAAHKDTHHDTKTNGSGPAGSAEFDYYLKGKPSTDHAQVQSKILAQIVEVVDSELSVEAKLKLVQQVQAHITAVHHKIMNSSNDELRQLAHDMGLGSTISEVPGNKERQWYVDFILKHGRAQ